MYVCILFIILFHVFGLSEGNFQGQIPPAAED